MGKCRIEFQPLRQAIPRGVNYEMDVAIRIVPEEIDISAERPQLRLGLVIDRSGSMSGFKIEQAKKAAEYIVENLTENDAVSIVTYDQNVDTIVPMSRIVDQNQVLSKIQSIEPGGRTALHDGWVQGGISVAVGFDNEALNRVILLSDGLANVGEVRPDTIVKDAGELATRGVSTTTVGVGMDYNEVLMSDIAKNADGNYWFIQSPEQLPTIFDRELKGLKATIGTGVVLSIESEYPVKMLNVLIADGDSGYRLPNLVSGMPVETIVRLSIDTADSDAIDVPILTATVKWLEIENDKNYATGELVLPSVEADDLPEYPIDEIVRQKVVLNDSARLKKEATEFITLGLIEDAKASMKEVNALLGNLKQDSAVLQELAAIKDLETLLTAGDYGLYNKMAHYQSHSRYSSHSHGDIFYRMGGGPVVGDITNPPPIFGLPVNAVVNSTDSNLLNGGMISMAIQRAAGSELLRELRSIGHCPTGSAVVTHGYKLPVGHIIHTVCPNWEGGRQHEVETLSKCYRRCLEEAEKLGIESVAFPALGIGGRRFPMDVAADCAILTVSNYLQSSSGIQAVQFICHDKKILSYYSKAFLKLTGR